MRINKDKFKERLGLKRILRVLSIVLCIALCGTLASVCSSAVNNNMIYAEIIDCSPGENIKVPVSIKGNTGFMGISLVFSFDPSVITPVSVSKGEIVTSGLFDDSIGTGKNNDFKVVWCGTKNITDDGEFCVLNFKVSDSASGEYKIKVSYEPQNTFDSNYKDVRMNCENIIVNVGNGQKPVEQSFWQKVVAWFEKVWNWFIGLFTK